MEKATVELRAAKTKLDTAETELTEAKRKLVTAQSKYDNHSVNPSTKRPKVIIKELQRAQGVVDQCTVVVTSKEAMFVTLNSTVLSLSAAPAPGKFER